MESSKTAIVISRLIELIEMIAGIFMTGFFSLAFIGCIGAGEGAGVALLVLVFVALGVLLIVKSRKRKALIDEFKKYVTKLSVDPTGSISGIASSLGTSEDVVRNNLNLMIKRKYFADAYIDKATDCIIVKSLSNRKASTASQNSPQAGQNNETTEMVSVTCKYCGGINSVPKGKVCECDYCGSPING